MSTELDAVRKLIHSRRFGALGVLNAAGDPYVAMVAYLSVADSTDVVLFLSRLSDQRRFLEASSRVSLLIEAGDTPAGEKLASPRVTLQGVAEPLVRTATLRERWLERHPESAIWIDFEDFAFFKVACNKARYIEGFGSMSRLTFD